MQTSKKQVFWFIFRFAVAFAIIWALFAFDVVSFDVFRENTLLWGYIALGFALGALPVLASIFRWRILLARQGTPLPFTAALRLTFVGFFFNMFVPGGTGGDVVKAYYVAKLFPGKGAEAATTVFVDRFAGFLGLLAVALVSCAAMFGIFWKSGRADIRITAAVILALVVIAIVGCVLLFNERFRGSRFAAFIFRFLPFKTLVGRVYGALEVYRRSPGVIAAAFGISVGNHVVSIVANYCFALALGIEVPFLLFAFLMAAAMAANLVPATPMNIGVGEAVVVVLFKMAPGVSDQVAYNCAWIAVIAHIAGILWSLAGSVFYVMGKDDIKKALDTEGRAQTGEPD